MSKQRAATIDVVKAEITRNALLSAAQEMNNTLIRSAYNPLIFDVKDFGVGIMGPTGELWADAPGLPGFTGVLPASIRSGIEHFGIDGFNDGDVLIVNSPYLNGTHISDTAVYMPVFFEGELVAFTGNMAHWADVGGMSPGGWTVDSTDIFQEGIRFSHQRLYSAGVRNEDFFSFIETNVRVSRIVLGDLNAQIATCRTGANRVIELCQRYGTDGVKQYMKHVLAQTGRALRDRVGKLPDGTYEASVRLDFNGVDRNEVPIIGVRTVIDGERILVDFDGTSATSRGPINAGAEATAAAVGEALMGILDPTGNANQSHLALAEIRWPEEPSILNPVAPAPCDSYGYVLTALVEIMLMALSEAVPEKARAGGYQMVAHYIMSTRATGEDSYLFNEAVQGGYGAFPGNDGTCLIFTGDGDVSNTPIEVVEMRFPVLCEQFSLDVDSAGAGRDRGGFGVARDFRILHEDSMVKTANENTVDLLSKGVDGGLPGRKSLIYLDRPGQASEELDERIGDTPVPQGTTLRVRTGGGGGFGSPFDREIDRVLSDLDNDYLTPEQAKEHYGVVAGQTGRGRFVADLNATAQLRAAAHQ